MRSSCRAAALLAVAQVHRTTPDGQTATFQPAEREDGLFVDDQTGSTWNILGEAVDGELTGSRLQAVPLDDTFWFVWFAFQPDTDILT